MANYCPNCGASVDNSASFCSTCGTALNASSGGNYNTTTNGQGSSTLGTILGTLVAVNLVGGLTRQLYYYNGRYFLDPYCRRPFMSPHRILGRSRPMGGMHPRPMMGGPMHPMGGPRGGGPRGGGFHGGPRGGGPGGPGGRR